MPLVARALAFKDIAFEWLNALVINIFFIECKHYTTQAHTKKN